MLHNLAVICNAAIALMRPVAWYGPIVTNTKEMKLMSEQKIILVHSVGYPKK